MTTSGKEMFVRKRITRLVFFYGNEWNKLSVKIRYTTVIFK